MLQDVSKIFPPLARIIWKALEKTNPNMSSALKRSSVKVSRLIHKCHHNVFQSFQWRNLFTSIESSLVEKLVFSLSFSSVKT